LMYYSRVDRGTCRAGLGSGKNNGEGFAAAGGDNQNDFGPQANVFSLSGENLLDVHGDFLMFLRVRSGAEDKGFLRLGGMSEPAGQGDRAEDRDGALAAQVEGSGPLHVTNDVDHAGVALGDGDYVVGLDFDVGRWVFAVEDLLHVELGARIAAGGVGARARQGDGAVFRQADDGNGGTRGLTRTASHGKNFVEGFAAAELDDARSCDGAENGDGLAAEFSHGDRDLRLLHVGFKAGVQLGFELLDGKTGGLDPSDQRQGDVAVGSDEDGLVTDIEAIERADQDLVVGAEHVAGGGGRGGCQGLLGRQIGGGGLGHGGRAALPGRDRGKQPQMDTDKQR